MATVRVSWYGETKPPSSVGYSVTSPLWTVKGLKITKGYMSKREVSVVRDGEDPKVYIVECRVLADGMGRPIYQCEFKLKGDDGELLSVCIKRAETPTTSMRNGLQELGAIGGKKWNGYDFFGLKMADVQKKLGTALPEPEDMSSQDQAQLKAVSNSPEFSKKEVKWVCCVYISFKKHVQLRSMVCLLDSSPWGFYYG